MSDGHVSEACIFCRIVAGEAEGSFVYRDERVSAFLDIRPVTPGHTLIVPNAHAAYLEELEAEDGAAMFRAGQRVAAALRASGLRCEGVNLFLADGEAAGQEVFHAHLHVFPRYAGDGFELRTPAFERGPAPREELTQQAEPIRRALGEVPDE